MNVLEKRIMFRTLCIVIVCTFLLVTELAFAMKVKLLTLEQMIETAEVVFIGVCISSESKEDQQINRMVDVTKFEVIEVIKGNISDTHAIHHYGGMVGKSASRIIGMPTYASGEKVILFLHPESQYRLTSPVGMFQGKFNFVIDEKPFTSSMVVNGINNIGLLSSMQSDSFLSDQSFNKTRLKTLQRLITRDRGPIPYDDFMFIVKTLVNKQSIGVER